MRHGRGKPGHLMILIREVTMRFTLSYVNMPDTTINFDVEFASMDLLQSFVEEHHKGWTSYQVVVLA